MPAPLLLAPIGVQKVVHDEGELATAARRRGRRPADDRQHRLRTSRSRRSPRRAATAPRWFQLYWPNDRELAAQPRRAAPRRPATARSSSPSTPSSPAGSRATCSRPGCRSSTAWASPTTSRTRSSAPALEKPPEEDVGAATGHFLGVQANPSLTWDDLDWLREHDLAADRGQGDPAPRRRPRGGAARHRRHRRLQPRRPPGRRRDRLARRPAGDRRRGRATTSTILFDSGVRGGADVLKALALGADAVCLGRPYIWGLALDGPGRASKRC